MKTFKDEILESVKDIPNNFYISKGVLINQYGTHMLIFNTTKENVPRIIQLVCSKIRIAKYVVQKEDLFIKVAFIIPIGLLRNSKLVVR